MSMEELQVLRKKVEEKYQVFLYSYASAASRGRSKEVVKSFYDKFKKENEKLPEDQRIKVEKTLEMKLTA